MIYLVFSIILTSYLTLSLKFIKRFHIPVFQAVVFNYLTCVITGSIVNSSSPFRAFNGQGWVSWAIVMGCIFISLFNLIGLTAQKLGVSVASVANKLSLVIPFIFSIYLYQENISAMKLSGVIIALAGVVLTCLPPGVPGAGNSKTATSLIWLLPAVLFFGSGLLDTLVKYVQQTYLDDNNYNSYLIAAFTTSAISGFLFLIIFLVRGRMKFDWRSIPAGIAIGIPNYFSIWCLIRVLKQHPGNSSAIIPVNNMGIVLFSTVVAWLFFSEKLSVLNWLGISLSVGAIALIAFG